MFKYRKLAPFTRLESPVFREEMFLETMITPSVNEPLIIISELMRVRRQ